MASFTQFAISFSYLKSNGRYHENPRRRFRCLRSESKPKFECARQTSHGPHIMATFVSKLCDKYVWFMTISPSFHWLSPCLTYWWSLAQVIPYQGNCRPDNVCRPQDYINTYLGPLSKTHSIGDYMDHSHALAVCRVQCCSFIWFGIANPCPNFNGGFAYSYNR